MTPRILIFSMTMGADYSFELISIETCVPQLIGHNKLFLGSVKRKITTKKICEYFVSPVIIITLGNKEVYSYETLD